MATIMIVDDSPIFRRSLRLICESAGHRVVQEAAEGQEAIAAYARGGIDLISMDIQLPGMDGLETVRRIRETDPNAVIVMISSLEQRSKVYEAIRLGAKHYITKPYTETKVAEVLNAVLQAAGRAATAGETSAERPKERAIGPTRAQERLKLDAAVLSDLPFALAIRDGRCELTIHKYITDGHVRCLHSCLQGLLYCHKARFLLLFEEPVLHEEGDRLLFEFVHSVRKRKGTIGIVAEAPGLFAPLQAKYKIGVYRSREEIEW